MEIDALITSGMPSLTPPETGVSLQATKEQVNAKDIATLSQQLEGTQPEKFIARLPPSMQAYLNGEGGGPPPAGKYSSTEAMNQLSQMSSKGNPFFAVSFMTVLYTNMKALAAVMSQSERTAMEQGIEQSKTYMALAKDRAELILNKAQEQAMAEIGQAVANFASAAVSIASAGMMIKANKEANEEFNQDLKNKVQDYEGKVGNKDTTRLKMDGDELKPRTPNEAQKAIMDEDVNAVGGDPAALFQQKDSRLKALRDETDAAPGGQINDQTTWKKRDLEKADDKALAKKEDEIQGFYSRKQEIVNQNVDAKTRVWHTLAQGGDAMFRGIENSIKAGATLITGEIDARLEILRAVSDILSQGMNASDATAREMRDLINGIFQMIDKTVSENKRAIGG